MLLAPPELFKNRLSLASCVQNFDQFVQIISRPRLYIFGINFDIMRRTAIPNPGDSHGHGLRWPQGRGKNAGFHVGKRSWAAANTGIDPFLNGHVTCHVMSYLLSWAKKDDIHDTYWWLLMHVIWFGDANAANGHEPNKKRKYHLDVLLPGENFHGEVVARPSAHQELCSWIEMVSCPLAHSDVAFLLWLCIKPAMPRLYMMTRGMGNSSFFSNAGGIWRWNVLEMTSKFW